LWTQGAIGPAVEILDTLFSVIFAVELLVKVISMGFDIYLRDSWNRLDCVIVLSSILSLMYPLAQLMSTVFAGGWRPRLTVKPITINPQLPHLTRSNGKWRVRIAVEIATI
jgi:hypothetical protein